MTIQHNGKLGGRRFVVVRDRLTSGFRALRCLECDTESKDRAAFLDHACEAARKRAQRQSSRRRADSDETAVSDEAPAT